MFNITIARNAHQVDGKPIVRAIEAHVNMYIGPDNFLDMYKKHNDVLDMSVWKNAWHKGFYSSLNNSYYGQGTTLEKWKNLFHVLFPEESFQNAFMQCIDRHKDTILGSPNQILTVAQHAFKMGCESIALDLLEKLNVPSKKAGYSKLKKLTSPALYGEDWLSFLEKQKNKDPSPEFLETLQVQFLVSMAGEKTDAWSGNLNKTKYNLEAMFETMMASGISIEMKSVISTFVQRFSGNTMIKDIMVSGMNFMHMKEMSSELVIPIEPRRLEMGASILSFGLEEILSKTDMIRDTSSLEYWENAVFQFVNQTRDKFDQPWRQNIMEKIENLVCTRMEFENHLILLAHQKPSVNGRKNFPKFMSENVYIAMALERSHNPLSERFLNVLQNRFLAWNQSADMEDLPLFMEDQFPSTVHSSFNSNGFISFLIALEDQRILAKKMPELIAGFRSIEVEKSFLSILHAMTTPNEKQELSKILPESFLVSYLYLASNWTSKDTILNPMSDSMAAGFEWLHLKGIDHWEQSFAKNLNNSDIRSSYDALHATIGNWTQDAKTGLQSLGISNDYVEQRAIWRHLFDQHLNRTPRASSELELPNSSFDG